MLKFKTFFSICLVVLVSQIKANCETFIYVTANSVTQITNLIQIYDQMHSLLQAAGANSLQSSQMQQISSLQAKFQQAMNTVYNSGTNAEGGFGASVQQVASNS